MRTATLVGVTAVPVDVEIDVGAGLPGFYVVGLPDATVTESRERVKAALKAGGFELPNARIVVNLAPGPLRKHGTGFDLPIALALLIATGQLPARWADGAAVVGELSLDGRVRRVPGLIAHGLTARDAGLSLLGPISDGGASRLNGLAYRPLARLTDLRQGLPSPATPDRVLPGPLPGEDFGDVVGQDLAVRALVIAAAGGHHVLMVGPPGSGKTMLARRLPTILPALEDHERLETALVHSVAGLGASDALAGRRPFRAPHHSASIAGLVGGGSPPRPGEVSLAHNGVLFLDEMPEFGPASLQCLRQPLEDGTVAIVRAEGRIELPARFALVGAANPCPCGYLGDYAHGCTCAVSEIDRYRARVGGPVMDRIDLVVNVARPDPAALLDPPRTPGSSNLRERVLAARERAARRGGAPPSLLSGAELVSACRLVPRARTALEHAARTHRLSGRGVTRLMRVARTIADLDDSDRVTADHVSEAVAYRATGRS